MKFISGILVTFLFMGSTMPGLNFSELAKFPHLIEHYALHDTDAKGSLSFVDFIKMHYGQGNENHKDEHQDKGCLPLQQPITHSGIIFVFAGDIQLPAHKMPAQQAEHVSYYIPLSSVPVPSSPWHPPKV